MLLPFPFSHDLRGKNQLLPETPYFSRRHYVSAIKISDDHFIVINSDFQMFSYFPHIFAKTTKTTPLSFDIYPETTAKKIYRSNLKFPENPKDLEKNRKTKVFVKKPIYLKVESKTLNLGRNPRSGNAGTCIPTHTCIHMC